MEALKTYLSAERGRMVRLAEALGIFPSAISQWERIPAERVLAIESFTEIPRHELRPDIYPRGEAA